MATFNRDSFSILSQKGDGPKAKESFYLTVEGFTDSKEQAVKISKRTVSDLFDFLDESGTNLQEAPDSKLVKSLDKRVTGLSAYILLNKEEGQDSPVRQFVLALQEVHEEMSETESTSNPLGHLVNYICSFTTPETIPTEVERIVSALNLTDEDAAYMTVSLKTKAEKNKTNSEGYIQSRKPKTPKVK